MFAFAALKMPTHPHIFLRSLQHHSILGPPGLIGIYQLFMAPPIVRSLSRLTDEAPFDYLPTKLRFTLKRADYKNLNLTVKREKPTEN